MSALDICGKHSCRIALPARNPFNSIQVLIVLTNGKSLKARGGAAEWGAQGWHRQRSVQREETGNSTICENHTVLCMLFYVHYRPLARVQHSRERYGV